MVKCGRERTDCLLPVEVGALIRETATRSPLKTMNALKFSAVLALLIITEIGWAEPLDSWTWRNPLPTGNNLNGIAYGNGHHFRRAARCV